jgi:hypothetical protein
MRSACDSGGSQSSGRRADLADDRADAAENRPCRARRGAKPLARDHGDGRNQLASQAVFDGAVRLGVHRRCIGAALRSLGWDEGGRAMWDRWSRTSDKFNEAEQDKTLASFSRRYDGAPIGPGTIIHLARMHDWQSPEEIEAKEPRWALTANGAKKPKDYKNAALGSARWASLAVMTFFTTGSLSPATWRTT